jgi:hypothetical protein
VLTSVTEFTIDTQIIDNFNPFSVVHGNKHIEQYSKDLIVKEILGGKSRKKFEKIKFWKVDIFLSG